MVAKALGQVLDGSIDTGRSRRRTCNSFNEDEMDSLLDTD